MKGNQWRIRVHVPTSPLFHILWTVVSMTM
jgi:hypothetical protein